jgi:hypothetical protein
MLTGAADRGSLPLACPACRSPVRWGADGAGCAACGARYGEADGVLNLTEGSVGRPGYDPHFFSRLT